MNLGRLLARRAASDGARAAVIESRRSLTFAELDRAANRVANGLMTRGIAPGDRVAAILRNGIDACALYYGAARAGVVLCPLNWRLAPAELAYQLEHCGAKLVVGQAEFAAKIAIGLTALEELGGADAPVDASVPAEAPLLICYTSGTTGRPKGAVLTHANMYAVAESVTSTLDYRAGDVNLIAAPMFHVGGLSFATMFVQRGATAVLMPAWSADEALRLVAEHKVNHFFAVPTMLAALLQQAGDMGSIRWLLTGAAPTPPEMFDAFARRGVELIDSYGCTETAGAALCRGRPFRHVEVQLVDGEIRVRGANVFAGYWKDQAASEAALAGGWLATGDLGREHDGQIRIVDRKKDLIISGGENVYPAEVEAVLEHHPALAELAVLGVPDAKWGEAVCAVVVLKPGQNVTLEELRRYCEGKLASFKQPSRLVVRASPLPRTATGKPMKNALRAQLQAGLG